MLVSVIIPVYNRQLELKRAIDSVLAQTINDVEVWVIDDGSDQDLKAIVNSFSSPKINYYRFEKRGNANVCRNAGIRFAKGEYIAMLDSDDEWLPMHLEQSISYLKEAHADGVFGGCLLNNGEAEFKRASRSFLPNEKMIDYLLSDGVCVTPSHVYTAASVKQILWDEALLRHQDYDFSVRYSERFKFIPNLDIGCIVHWRKNEPRAFDYKSQWLFMNRYKAQIRPDLYRKYCMVFYFQVRKRSANHTQDLDHIRHELYKNFKVLSLRDYQSIQEGKITLVRRIILRISYGIRYVISRLATS